MTVLSGGLTLALVVPLSGITPVGDAGAAVGSQSTIATSGQKVVAVSIAGAVPRHPIKIRIRGKRLGKRAVVRIRGAKGPAKGYRKTVHVRKVRILKNRKKGTYRVKAWHIVKGTRVSEPIVKPKRIKVTKNKGAKTVITYQRVLTDVSNDPNVRPIPRLPHPPLKTPPAPPPSVKPTPPPPPPSVKPTPPSPPTPTPPPTPPPSVKPTPPPTPPPSVKPTPPPPTPGTPATMLLASVSSTAEQGNADSDRPALSEDGRVVTFDSTASNLVSGDTNGKYDVFRRDSVTKKTKRVSVASDGGQSNGDSFSSRVSEDGRFVTYYSDASNLVMGDSNKVNDVFLYDNNTGKTTRISESKTGREGDRESRGPAISGDGRFIAFQSSATNLVPGDTSGATDVFLYDTRGPSLTRISLDDKGHQANGPSTEVSISHDGNFIAYESDASDLVAHDTNGEPDVFLYDRANATTTMISVADDGTQGDEWSGHPAISEDGQHVVYGSEASTLVPGDSNSVADPDIMFYDVATARTTRVSVASDGTQTDLGSSAPAISGDGRFVTFHSAATNLVPNDTNDEGDVFLHDRFTSKTTRVSVAVDGTQADHISDSPEISRDGMTLAFGSDATNLVTSDSNSDNDVFLTTLR